MQSVHKSVATKSRKICSVPKCSSYCTEDISLHAFPADPKLSRTWQTALKFGKTVTKHMLVCSQHFTHSDFISATNQRRRLKKHAIPSQNIPQLSHSTKKTVIDRPKTHWLQKCTLNLKDVNDQILLDTNNIVENNVERTFLKTNTLPSLNLPRDGAIQERKRRRKSEIEPDEEFRFVDVNAIKERGKISSIQPPSSPGEFPLKDVGTQTDLVEKLVLEKMLDTRMQIDQSNMLDYIRNEILNVTLKLENNEYALTGVKLYFASQQDNKNNFIVVRPEETVATNVQLMQAFALFPGIRKKHVSTPMSGTTHTMDDRETNSNQVSIYHLMENQKVGDPLNLGNDGVVVKTESIPMLDDDDPEFKNHADRELMTNYVNVNNTLEIKPVDPTAEEHDMVCVYCMTVFETGVELIAHFRDKLCRRKEEVPKNALCELCGIVVSYPYLRKHIINKHDTKPFDYKCNECGKRFAFHNTMKKHVLTHAKKRTFECSECPKRFKTEAVLRAHKYMCHTDPKQWKHECIHCKKRFYLKLNMLKHERTHLSQKSCECEMCEQILPNKKILDEHIATCSKRSTTDLDQTSDNVCWCSYCFELFSTEQLLDEHVTNCSKLKITMGTDADSDLEDKIEIVKVEQ